MQMYRFEQNNSTQMLFVQGYKKLFNIWNIPDF